MPFTRRALVEPLEGRLVFSVPTGFADLPVVSGMASPVAFAFAPDGRVFVCEQGGDLRVVKDGALLPTPFAHFNVDRAGERGLLGVAFDPNFEQNQFVYVYYTSKTPSLHNRVTRLTAAGDVAQPGSEQVIFDLDPLDAGAAIHNGGSLRFGLDGKLYISTGENARPNLAQDLASTMGKLLRINPDGSVPADNPFADRASPIATNAAVWAYGFRNPFTFDIHRTSGKIYVNDVGSDKWEEIDQAVGGGNYGWPRSEGPTTDPAFRTPVYAYPHGTPGPDGVSGHDIVGGTFYDPVVPQFPAEYGDDYFFSDGNDRWIDRLEGTTGTVSPFATEVGPAFNVSTGPDGSLYYLVYSGELRKISYLNADTAPQITRQPASVEAAAGQPATFSVEAIGRQPLNYQWQRDGQDIPGATGSSYTLPSAIVSDDSAMFRVVVSNELGSTTSAAATLTVTSDTPPVATITSPKEGQLYKAGQKLKFAGRATDAEDGKLPKSAYTWEVVFHHDTHTHPFMAATGGITKGSVLIPRENETSANVWYRVHLTVTDSHGLTTEVTRDIHPRTVTVHVAAAPPGARLFLDGQPITAPFSFTGVAGIQRTLEAPASQVIDGVGYTFRTWSKGGKRAAITLLTPGKDTTYTATYVAG
jgi:glucose/arabinose dehydrogenase